MSASGHMARMGHTPPPFFKRGPGPLAQLTFYVACCVLLLFLDLRYQTLETLRLTIAAALWPVQQAALLPMAGASDAGNYVANLSRLQRENSALRARQLAQANQLLRQAHLDDENRRLRNLLGMAERIGVPTFAADVLYATHDPFTRRIVIDRGSTHDIALGRAVIDDLGVVGQVTRVFPLASEVTLLTDKQQTIPVQIQRNGLRAVLAGAGNGAMELKYLPGNADVRPDDTLVTSGLDGIYLPGLPVARVAGIDRDQSYAFARIACVPLAGIERNGPVLVLGARPQPPGGGVADVAAKPANERKSRASLRRQR